MPRKKFLRRTSERYSKLGKLRKKKQKWKKPTGRHNKMRLKEKGYPVVISIGYRTKKSSRGLINKKIPRQISNIKDLEKVQKNEIAILGKIGKKKKLEIAKKAQEKKIDIYNLNIKKFLKAQEKKEEKPIKEKEEIKNKGDKK